MYKEDDGTIYSFKELLNEIMWSWEYPEYDLIKTENGNFNLNKLYIARTYATYKMQTWELVSGVFEQVEKFYDFLNKV